MYTGSSVAPVPITMCFLSPYPSQHLTEIMICTLNIAEGSGNSLAFWCTWNIFDQSISHSIVCLVPKFLSTESATPLTARFPASQASSTRAKPLPSQALAFSAVSLFLFNHARPRSYDLRNFPNIAFTLTQDFIWKTKSITCAARTGVHKEKTESLSSRMV